MDLMRMVIHLTVFVLMLLRHLLFSIASNESDEGDNYVDGEDTPIEIIYVPPLEENRRPSDVYQINNYELVEPQPPFGFGFDPLFMEGKIKLLDLF